MNIFDEVRNLWNDKDYYKIEHNNYSSIEGIINQLKITNTQWSRVFVFCDNNGTRILKDFRVNTKNLCEYYEYS